MAAAQRTRIGTLGVIAACGALAMGMTGCNSAGEGALFGAGLGAGGGAIIGSIFGEAGAGAAIGAVSGALVGGVVGDQNQRNASYARSAASPQVVYAEPPQQQTVVTAPPPQQVVVYGAPPPQVVYYTPPPPPVVFRTYYYGSYGPRHVCGPSCGCGGRYYRSYPRWRGGYCW